MEQHIREGLVVVARGVAATITRVLPDNRIEVKLYNQPQRLLVGLEDIQLLPVKDDANVALLTSSYFELSNSDSYEEMMLASERFECLSEYLSKKINVSEARKRLGVSNGLFYKLRKQYDAELGAISLLRMTRGRKKGERALDDTVEKLISFAIDREFEGKAATYMAVWREVEALCIEKDLPAPSINTVISRIKLLPERELYKKKNGTESTNQKYGARPGKLTTKGPLEHVQMDHTLVDVILCTDDRTETIGRPWITVLIDKHTRVLLGYYLSLHAPSTLSVACAVTHAVLPKTKFLERLGLDRKLYPFFGKPRLLHMDNAKEFKSPKFQRACAKHQIKNAWRPYGKKHYGGHVERLIGTYMTAHVHFLPGTTFSNTQQRKGYDSEKNASLTFKEFSKWFAGQVAIYHNTKHSALESSPKVEWEKHFSNTSGEVRIPPVLANSWEFRLDFMPEERRNIHPWGVEFKNKVYWSGTLIPFIGSKNVIVKYDPFSLSAIWLWLGDSYIAVNYADLTTADWSIAEYEAATLSKTKSGSGIRAGALVDADLVRVRRANQTLVTESKKLTKAAKKRHAASMEYRDAYADLESQLNSKSPKEPTEKIDYSTKPAPFRRGE